MIYLGPIDLAPVFQSHYEAGAPTENIVEELVVPLKKAGHAPHDVNVRFCHSRHAGKLARTGTDRDQAYQKGQKIPLSPFPETNERDWKRFARHGVQPNQGLYVTSLSTAQAVPLVKEMRRHGRPDLLMMTYRQDALHFRFPLEDDFALFRVPPAEALLGFFSVTIADFAPSSLSPQQRDELDELESRMQRLRDYPEIKAQTRKVLRSLHHAEAKAALLELVSKVDRHIEIPDYVLLISTLSYYRDTIKNLDEIIISANSEMSAKKNLASYRLELNTFRLFCSLPGLEEIAWGTTLNGQEYDLLLTLNGQKVVVEIKQSYNTSRRKTDQRQRLLDYAQRENAILIYIYGTRREDDPPITTKQDLAHVVTVSPRDTLNFLVKNQEK